MFYKIDALRVRLAKGRVNAALRYAYAVIGQSDMVQAARRCFLFGLWYTVLAVHKLKWPHPLMLIAIILCE